MLVVVWRLLVSFAHEVRMGMVMRSRRGIVGVRGIDFPMCTIMLMLVGMQVLVRVSVRMAVRHVTVGMDVIVAVLVGMNMLMRVRLDRLIDGRRQLPPCGGVMANNGTHDCSEGGARLLMPAGPPSVPLEIYRRAKFTSIQRT